MNLFRKKIQPACGYCAFAREGEDENLICFYSGPTTPEQSCKRFRYDPLQRDPNGWHRPDHLKREDTWEEPEGVAPETAPLSPESEKEEEASVSAEEAEPAAASEVPEPAED